MMTHERACAMAKVVEGLIENDEPITEDEAAIYTLWRGYRSMKWATEHPIRALLIRLRNRFL